MPTSATWICPHCGHDDNWFDRSCHSSGASSAVEGPFTRCARCGKADCEPVAAAPSFGGEADLPLVAGLLRRPVPDLERALLVCLKAELDKADFSDQALIATLCDSIRLCREQAPKSALIDLSQMTLQQAITYETKRLGLVQWWPGIMPKFVTTICAYFVSKRARRMLRRLAT